MRFGKEMNKQIVETGRSPPPLNDGWKNGELSNYGTVNLI